MAGVMRRLKRALSAEVHDMLDEHETPDRIAKQLVLETTEKVENAQKLTIDAVASEKQLKLQLNEHNTALSKAQGLAESAMQNGDESAARQALENKLHHQKLVDALSPQLERAETNSANLKNQLADLKKKLNTLQSEKLAIEARYNGAQATGKIDAMSAELHVVDDAEARMQKANSMITALEARNEAVADVAAATNLTPSNESDQQMESELNKLREKISTQAK